MPEGATEPGPPGEDRRASSIPRVPVLAADVLAKTLAVKEGETFLCTDVEGNIDDRKELGLGLYYRDTRFLSHLRMRIAGLDPILLSSSAERAYMSHVDLTNPAILEEDRPEIPQHTLSIRRIRTVAGRMFERIRIKNYNPFPVDVDLELTFGTDFADIFEVRGLSRETRGTFDPPRVRARNIEFAYHGQDGVRRVTRIEFESRPRTEVRGDLVVATFAVHLSAGETKLVALTVEPDLGERRPARVSFDTAVHRLRRSYDEWEADCTQITSDNELFNQWLRRGLRDLRALYTEMDGGGIVAAGIPWYVAAFGRDSLLTSHQTLILSPRTARDSLRILASRQGTEFNDWRDEEPGKILHEIRRGELVGSGYLPHGPYYGSVDSTPWFLILLAQYFRWTNDLAFVRELLPAAEAALRWIDEYGDADGDGFVEYRSRSPRGLRNHGWKDSDDSVVHEDGTPAEPPIALVEVQGYVYLAKARMAFVFAALGEYETAGRLRDEATVLRKRLNDAFWMEDQGYFCHALDGRKRQVRTIVSNPGHLLYCDVVDQDRAERVTRRLLQPDMFSGWGVRTMSKAAAAYNPMSYHNGTVWPHDNALIAAGMKRFGYVDTINRLTTALFEAAGYEDYLRLPELFCGFTRRSPSPPVGYPVACSPQAWAAGAPFLLLQGMLGISAVAHENLLRVNAPHLPRWLSHLELRKLRVGDSVLTLEFRREGDVTAFSITGKEGDVRVVMEE
jgi:glycogen debranching enzyme